LILAIDALAAKGVDRLTTSVQLSDVGISPGSGVGNRRAALDKDSLGVDVLSIGVPTVVDSSTLVYDVLEQGGMSDLSPELRAILENGKNFFVTSKDCDIAVIALSNLIAHAINTVFAPALSESAF
jgi:spore protease